MFEPPGVRADSPEGKRDEVILKCRVKGKSFILSLVYNMILITTCTIYAVKTRKIPENFNESKFIGFTMYTTIVIWLAFVTMFFGTNNSYEVSFHPWEPLAEIYFSRLILARLLFVRTSGSSYRLSWRALMQTSP